MQNAILVVSGLSLVASVGTLAIMIKVAKELKTAKSEVDEFKAKADHNIGAVRRALRELDL